MQTLRKLPAQSPSRTAPATISGSAPTQHLVQQNAGSDGDVERFRAAREWNRHALRGDFIEVWPDAGSFVAHHHRDQLLPRRARFECARQRHTIGGGRPEEHAVLAAPRNERCVVELDDAPFIAWGREHGVLLWAAAADGVPLPRALEARTSRKELIAVMVGNEGAGIRPHLNEIAAQRVAIPLARGAESLNVAVAAGILLYEVLRGR